MDLNHRFLAAHSRTVAAKALCGVVLLGVSCLTLAATTRTATASAPGRSVRSETLQVLCPAHLAYSVHRENGGYRYRVRFATPSVRLHGMARTGLVENVLFTSHHRDAQLDILLRQPAKVSALPVAGGYQLRFTARSGISEDRAADISRPLTPLWRPATVAVPPLRMRTFSTPTQMRGLHFHRGQKGQAELVLQIGGPQPTLQTRKQPGMLRLTLQQTALLATLARPYNVTQFGTLVPGFSLYPIGHATRIDMSVQGLYRYAVFQVAHQIRISVQRERHPSAAPNLRLSMRFQHIAVRDAIQVIASFAHRNIIVSNAVTGSLSVHLRDEPWKEALKVLMDADNLGSKRVGNILWVAPAAQIRSQEESQLKLAASKRKLEPLMTTLIPLKYANATHIATLLRGFSKSQAGQGVPSALRTAALGQAMGIPSTSLIGNTLLGARGTVSVVQRTNSLLIRDTPRDIRNIRHLLAKIDRPIPQVLISARIVQITTSAARELGVQWGGSYTSTGGGGVVNVSGTGATGTTATQGTEDQSSAGVPALVNLPAYAPVGSALTGIDPASLGLALGTVAGNRILDLQLQALQADNRARIISSPKVLTQDNEKAIIEQGQEIPYQSATSSGATAVSFKKAELSLAVTPHISPNGRITMTVLATNNQPNYTDATPDGIPIDTQQVKTRLMTNNGQTVVIGGIYTQTTNHYNTGVPVLKNIPLLGWLFKSRTDSVSKTELLVFLKPTIISQSGTGK